MKKDSAQQSNPVSTEDVLNRLDLNQEDGVQDSVSPLSSKGGLLSSLKSRFSHKFQKQEFVESLEPLQLASDNHSEESMPENPLSPKKQAADSETGDIANASELSLKHDELQMHHTQLKEKYAKLEKLLNEKNLTIEKIEKELSGELKNRKDFNKLKDILEKELKETRDSCRQLRNEVTNAKTETDSYVKRITQLEDKITKNEKEILEFENQLKESQAEVNKEKERNQELVDKIQTQVEALKEKESKIFELVDMMKSSQLPPESAQNIPPEKSSTDEPKDKEMTSPPEISTHTVDQEPESASGPQQTSDQVTPDAPENSDDEKDFPGSTAEDKTTLETDRKKDDVEPPAIVPEESDREQHIDRSTCVPESDEQAQVLPMQEDTLHTTESDSTQSTDVEMNTSVENPGNSGDRNSPETGEGGEMSLNSETPGNNSELDTEKLAQVNSENSEVTTDKSSSASTETPPDLSASEPDIGIQDSEIKSDQLTVEPEKESPAKEDSLPPLHTKEGEDGDQNTLQPIIAEKQNPENLQESAELKPVQGAPLEDLLKKIASSQKTSQEEESENASDEKTVGDGSQSGWKEDTQQKHQSKKENSSQIPQSSVEEETTDSDDNTTPASEKGDEQGGPFNFSDDNPGNSNTDRKNSNS